MNPNMTGEPNQQHSVHPSVFNFEPYPPSQPIIWNETNPFLNAPSGSSSTNSLFQQVNVPQPSVSLPLFGGTQLPGPANVLESNLHARNVFNPDDKFSFVSTNPGVVQFPFDLCLGRPIRCKRKTDSPPLQSAKQHITEEKMAEHMSKLHISSETASSKETDTGRMQRLYMCEEMRKLQTDSIIPPNILTKIQQPCKALVLWNPPQRIIPNELALPDENENENNNAANISDNNVVAVMEDEIVVNNMEMDNC